MRWVPLVILVYAVLLVQTSLVRLVTFTFGSVGTVGPDLLAAAAVFVAMNCRSGIDVMLAAWIAGIAADLGTGGTVGGMTAVGPMAISYALAAGAVFQIRDAFFRERVWTRFALALLFALLAHGLWVTMQSLLVVRHMTWADYWRMVLQAVLIAVYTAAAMPLVYPVLQRVPGLFVAASGARGRRYYR